MTHIGANKTQLHLERAINLSQSLSCIGPSKLTDYDYSFTIIFSEILY